MISPQVHAFLNQMLSTGTVEFPPAIAEPFASGFEPHFQACHITAAKAEAEKGYPAVAGVAFLNLNGKLYPWPHFVNMRASGELVDFSPRPDQAMLGFIRIAFHQRPMMQPIIDQYNALHANAGAPVWNDQLADGLGAQHMPMLLNAYNANQLSLLNAKGPA